jgi:hypothetical protein
MHFRIIGQRHSFEILRQNVILIILYDIDGWFKQKDCYLGNSVLQRSFRLKTYKRLAIISKCQHPYTFFITPSVYLLL